MSDKIKKIKIKQQDGTMSDYYDIGVNAQNVDINYNGSNVEATLKKTPKYYDNVASMKLDDTLVEGDMAITLGYYTANDGGGAEYKIVSGNYIDDGGSYHKLISDLYAELIIRNCIYPEQFGAKTDTTFDCANIISKCLEIAADKETIVKFNGERKFYTLTSILFPNKHIRMEGDNCFDSENIRNIVYLGNDAMFNTYDGSQHEFLANIRGLNFYIPRNDTTEVAIFKNIVFSTSIIDSCTFINAGYVFDNGGLVFCSTLSNCKSLFIRKAIFNRQTTVNLSDSVIKNNYFNGYRKTYPSMIIGSIDNDNIFDSNFIDYFKYIIKNTNRNLCFLLN